MNPDHQPLLDGFLDKTLGENGLRELRLLLETDAELRRALAVELRLRGLAHGLRHPFDSGREALADKVEASIADATPRPEEENILRTIEFSKRRAARRRLLVWGFAIAAQVAIAAGLWMYFSPDTHAPRVIARIDSQAGGAFLLRGQTKLMMNAGDPVCDGDQVFIRDDAEAEAVLLYPDTTRLKLRASSYARLSEVDRAKRIQLLAGQLEMKVAPQPKDRPMELLTEHSRSIVRGTEFRMNSSENATLLEVSEGKVEVRPANGAPAATVTADQFAITGPGGAPTVHRRGTPLAATPLLTKETAGHRAPLVASLGPEARKLYLVVTNGGDNNRFDHAAWISPRLVGPKGELRLTALDWKTAKSGWATSRVNRGFFGETPKVLGAPVSDCIVTHATSVIEYDIPAGYDRFESDCGLLDSGATQPHAGPSVVFEIYTTMPEEKLRTLLIRKNFY